MELRPVTAALEISTTVHNCGDATMPFSFGLHPYFNVDDLYKTRLTGLAERCLNHLEMAEAATVDQLKRLPEGVDFLCRPAGPVSLIDDATGVTTETESVTVKGSTNSLVGLADGAWDDESDSENS